MNGGLQISYQLSKASLAAVEKRLGALKSKAPQVIARALNRTAVMARSKIVRQIRQSYTVKAGKARSNMKIRRASFGNLVAVIRVSGRPMSATSFKHSMTKRQGAKIQVVKSGGLKPVISRKQGNNKSYKRGAILQRVPGAGRLPIRAMVGPGMPKMAEMAFDGKGAAAASKLKPDIEERLAKEIDHEINRLLAKA